MKKQRLFRLSVVLPFLLAFCACGRNKPLTFGALKLPNFPGGGNPADLVDLTLDDFLSSSNPAQELVDVGLDGSPFPIAPVAAATSLSQEGTSVSTVFSNAVPMVIDITGSVEAYYDYPQIVNAGVNPRISIDGVDCAASQSFEGSSRSITFNAVANCITLLLPGTHAIRVYDDYAGRYPNMAGYKSKMQYTALPAPGMGLFSPIVAMDSVSADGTGITRTFTNLFPVVINAVGYVRGTYSSPNQVSNAGVNARVSIDGEPCAAHFSFEGESASIRFDSSVRCIRLLNPGTHTIRVEDTAAGGYPNMSGYYTQLQYTAMAAPSGSSPYPPIVYAREITSDSASVSVTLSNLLPIALTLSGYVKGTYHSDSQSSNAGVKGVIRVDGEVCAKDFSFEGTSISITFHSNPSCIKILAPGNHTIQVSDDSAGNYPNMGGYQSRLQLQALALP